MTTPKNPEPQPTDPPAGDLPGDARRAPSDRDGTNGAERSEIIRRASAERDRGELTAPANLYAAAAVLLYG